MEATAVLLGQKPGHNIPASLSAIYAFDLFVYNADRHAGNHMVVTSKSDHSLVTYDFSRAFTFHGWPPPKLPMPANSNTVVTYSILRTKQPFEIDPAINILERINAVPVVKVKEFLEQMPVEWMQKKARKSIVQWWSSGARKLLVDAIKTGLKNGTYL